MLNQRNSLQLFEQLMQSYENTGILDRQKLTALGQILGADFLLMSRLKAEKMDIVFSKGNGGSLDLSLIDVRTAQPMWAGLGEWKHGGVYGFGGASDQEAAVGLVSRALDGLR